MPPPPPPLRDPTPRAWTLHRSHMLELDLQAEQSCTPSSQSPCLTQHWVCRQQQMMHDFDSQAVLHAPVASVLSATLTTRVAPRWKVHHPLNLARTCQA